MREVAVALASVLALHAALALWLIREGPARVEPREMPRTIVARLLSMPSPPAVTVPPRAAVPTPAHTPPQPRAIPETNKKIAMPPQPAQRPGTLARHEEAVAPTPPSPPLAGTPTTAAPSAAPSTPEPTAPPQAMRAPKPVSHVDCSIAQPDYPEAAQRRGEAGTAVVRFVVDVDGRIESAQIVRSSGYTRLDNAALDALRSGTCRPSRDAGVPVRVVFEQPFVFGLAN
ncbi:energy transducer TonB [Paraburkholderia dinghuensis]|nr:energy transducer TonB [Paraburkholderia dinghuensis]